MWPEAERERSFTGSGNSRPYVLQSCFMQSLIVCAVIVETISGESRFVKLIGLGK